LHKGRSLQENQKQKLGKEKTAKEKAKNVHINVPGTRLQKGKAGIGDLIFHQLPSKEAYPNRWDVLYKD